MGKLVEVKLSCGRFYLSVAGHVVAMEGDPCRDMGVIVAEGKSVVEAFGERDYWNQARLEVVERAAANWKDTLEGDEKFNQDTDVDLNKQIRDASLRGSNVFDISRKPQRDLESEIRKLQKRVDELEREKYIESIEAPEALKNALSPLDETLRNDLLQAFADDAIKDVTGLYKAYLTHSEFVVLLEAMRESVARFIEREKQADKREQDDEEAK